MAKVANVFILFYDKNLIENFFHIEDNINADSLNHLREKYEENIPVEYRLLLKDL